MHATLIIDMLCISQNVYVQHYDKGLYLEWLI